MTTIKNAERIEVGAFSYVDGAVVGPAAYMDSGRYAECMAKIEAGHSAVFNFAAVRATGVAGTVRAVLVAIQTDYAAWRGARAHAWGIEVRS